MFKLCVNDLGSERYPLTSQLIQENKIPEFGVLFACKVRISVALTPNRQSLLRF